MSTLFPKTWWEKVCFVWKDLFYSCKSRNENLKRKRERKEAREEAKKAKEAEG